jgi:hypothetical protein
MANFITTVINGIKDIIKGFKMIICFFATVPTRIANINAGFNNVFKGVHAEFEAIGTSFVMGTSSIGLLGAYIGELIRTYSKCGIKYITNFFDCIIYYLVNIFLFVCYLPIMIILWVLDSFIGINLYGLETSVVKKIDMVDEIIFPYTEFHINKWPKSVREHCFLCTKLKTSAVKKTAADVNKVFTEKIPQNFKDAGKFFTIGNKQFAEIFNMPVKTPDSFE